MLCGIYTEVAGDVFSYYAFHTHLTISDIFILSSYDFLAFIFTEITVYKLYDLILKVIDNWLIMPV